MARGSRAPDRNRTARRRLDPHAVAWRTRRRGVAPGTHAGRRTAAWRSRRGEGQHRRRGLAHHGRVPRLRLRRRSRCHRRRTPAGSRRGHRRQDEPRPVRDRSRRHALTTRRRAQHVRPGVHLRRLERRLGQCSRTRAGAGCARHRHSGLGPHSRGLQQRRWPEADARLAVDGRCRAGLPHARLRVGVRAAGGRLRAGGTVGRGRRCRRRVLEASPARCAGGSP